MPPEIPPDAFARDIGAAQASVRAPRLPGRVMMRHEHDQAIDALLADLYIHAGNCVRRFGDFHFAVSAAPEAEPALMRLMYDINFREFPWKRTRLWMTDELDVAADDGRHRATRLSETIIACSGIPQSQCHLLSMTDGISVYERALGEHLGWREKGHDRLDFVFLTIQHNGIISGLPQATPPVRSLHLPPRYITGARLIAVLGGDGVAEKDITKVEAEIRSPAPSSTIPLRDLLTPIGGELHWYLCHSHVRSLDHP